ncbi:hypothetical protein KV205_10135 [Streptomyces sp. SKN60]|uniref:hypothetical protein n=1 Tax=Streptomyces sp. SKN60 TaxID=2855506 RepID=UPI002247DD69|nr:hypothetical protein [Streptomyces sp. SKN60]MCX2180886.1 hypothetical protein [Streptomyces sp. SKN60]
MTPYAWETYWPAWPRRAGDSTAVDLGRAQPSDTCRICHFDVCPSQPAPAGSPALLAQWQKNARGWTG